MDADEASPLGRVRKTFFQANFSLVGISIRLGARIPQKKLKPLSQYFPLRKCNRKLRIYTENMQFSVFTRYFRSRFRKGKY